MIRIESIADHTALVGAIACWHWNEWGRADPAGSPESWAESLRRRAGRDQVPTTYVALEDERLVGSVTLDEHDMSTHRELSPWLAGLYVVPERRGRGIGSALVRHLLQKTTEMGLHHLYLYTSTARVFYEKLGWRLRADDFYEGVTVYIMQIDLAE